MNKLDKLAELFEKEANSDIFGETSLSNESSKISDLAGKLFYKSTKTHDPRTAKKLHEAGKLLLMASDILKRL